MSESLWPLLALSLAGAIVAAGLMGRRRGADRRDIRLMLGVGAGLGGLALFLHA